MVIHILTGFCDLHLFSQADNNSTEESRLVSFNQIFQATSSHQLFKTCLLLGQILSLTPDGMNSANRFEILKSISNKSLPSYFQEFLDWLKKKKKIQQLNTIHNG